MQKELTPDSNAHAVTTYTELFGDEYEVVVEGDYEPAERGVYDWGRVGYMNVCPPSEASFTPYRVLARRITAVKDGVQYKHIPSGPWFTIPVQAVSDTVKADWASTFFEEQRGRDEWFDEDLRHDRAA